MNTIKRPDLINPFNEEYLLTETNPALSESTEMMRQRANRRVWEINQKQREKDKEKFYRIYSKWYEKYCVCSNPFTKFKDPMYEELKKMGRRALPAIYELATEHDIFLIGLLENIYDCKSPSLEIHSLEDIEADHDKVNRFWIQKMESDNIL